MPAKNVLPLLKALKKLYPHHIIPLRHKSAWELLCAVILSAQCTDARVNIVCKELFRRFPDAISVTEGSIAEIEEIIRPCGLFRTKAKSIYEMSRMICEDFGGKVPDTMDATRRGAQDR